MPKNKRSKKRIKMPYHGDNVIIYGILHIPTKKLVKVDLNENDILFDYNLSLYPMEEYAIIKFNVSF